VIFVGDDWAEGHHDVEIVDEQGRRRARRRLPEGVEGVAELHALVADCLGDRAEGDAPDDPAQVVVGIETDRGPWVQTMVVAGYRVYAINPVQVARYRERHGTSGAKSDPGMPTCWPSWSGWTGPITGRWRRTPESPSRSRCWPAPIRIWCGPGSGRPTDVAVDAARVLPRRVGRVRHRSRRP